MCKHLPATAVCDLICAAGSADEAAAKAGAPAAAAAGGASEALRWGHGGSISTSGCACSYYPTAMRLDAGATESEGSRSATDEDLPALQAGSPFDSAGHSLPTPRRLAADGDPPAKRQHTGSPAADGAPDEQRQAQQAQGSAAGAQAADGHAGDEGGSGDGGGLAGLLGGYGSDDNDSR